MTTGTKIVLIVSGLLTSAGVFLIGVAAVVFFMYYRPTPTTPTPATQTQGQPAANTTTQPGNNLQPGYLQSQNQSSVAANNTPATTQQPEPAPTTQTQPVMAPTQSTEPVQQQPVQPQPNQNQFAANSSEQMQSAPAQQQPQSQQESQSIPQPVDTSLATLVSSAPAAPQEQPDFSNPYQQQPTEYPKPTYAPEPLPVPDNQAYTYFYQPLSQHGDWIFVRGFGHVWQPQPYYTGRGWRPYTHGHWVMSEAGWTWVSTEAWGWCTYHYGRWAMTSEHGWVWIPGNTWAPAWVTWRQGPGFVGWAPLPPGAPIGGMYRESEHMHPGCWTMVAERDFMAPYCATVAFPLNRCVQVLPQSTVIVNASRYNNIIVNIGPSPHRISVATKLPMTVMKITPEETHGHKDFHTQVVDNSLHVFRPSHDMHVAPQNITNVKQVASATMVITPSKVKIDTTSKFVPQHDHGSTTTATPTTVVKTDTLTHPTHHTDHIPTVPPVTPTPTVTKDLSVKTTTPVSTLVHTDTTGTTSGKSDTLTHPTHHTDHIPTVPPVTTTPTVTKDLSVKTTIPVSTLVQTNTTGSIPVKSDTLTHPTHRTDHIPTVPPVTPPPTVTKDLSTKTVTEAVTHQPTVKKLDVQLPTAHTDHQPPATITKDLSTKTATEAVTHQPTVKKLDVQLPTAHTDHQLPTTITKDPALIKSATVKQTPPPVEKTVVPTTPPVITKKLDTPPPATTIKAPPVKGTNQPAHSIQTK